MPSDLKVRQRIPKFPRRIVRPFLSHIGSVSINDSKTAMMSVGVRVLYLLIWFEIVRMLISDPPHGLSVIKRSRFLVDWVCSFYD